ncbi:MAG: hypothetical protein AMS27_11850 [Bacteroides sp. SM23_62_1]|nr:MAG: hypothetical protein AMS27_11850 [Bacteroides sp. SM23_62_1]
MESKSYLNLVESKAYRTVFIDGTFDMFFGLFLTGVGVNVVRLKMGMDTSNAITLSVLLLIPIFILVKIFLTMPRIGYVKFSMTRIKRNFIALVIAIFIQLVFGILFLSTFVRLPEVELFSKVINPVTQFIFIVVFFSIIGFFIDYNRFYLIGLAGGIGLFLVDLVVNKLASILIVAFSFGFTGIFLFTTGLILFLRFLKDYPKPDLSV